MEFIIDYTLKDVMSDKEFAQHITKGKIYECQYRNCTQKQTWLEVNEIRQKESYQPISLSSIKYYW